MSAPLTLEIPSTVDTQLVEYITFPTVEVWSEKYADVPDGTLTDLGVTAQENLIGVLFAGQAEDIRRCKEAGMTFHWFGVWVLAAACEAILEIPEAGERDLDPFEVRDALINADCLGERPYQLPTSAWCRFADRSSHLPVEHHLDRLVQVYNDEAARIRKAMERLEA